MHLMNRNDTSNHTKDTGKRGVAISIIVLVIVLALAFFAYDSLARTARQEQLQQAQAAAQDSDSELAHLVDYNATVYTDTGEPLTLVEIAAGKPLVMNFWATWCPYCIKEMPDYETLHAEYGDRVSFAFVDVADGKRETVQGASEWMNDNGYDLPTFYDTTLEASYAFGATSLPTTVIVAANGDILDISVGAIDLALMRKALDSVLKG